MREAHAGFWVPDYPRVRAYLERRYSRFRVREHSAEPGRVGGHPSDADVTVRGDERDVTRFIQWLRLSGLEHRVHGP